MCQISSQAAQLQAMQDKLAAEVELRKKFEKRLEDYRQEELRRKTREDDAGVKTTSPPDQRLLGGRRWSLYTRRCDKPYHLVFVLTTGRSLTPMLVATERV